MTQRRRSLVWLAVSIVLLTAGAWLARSGLSQLSAERRATAELNAKRVALESLLPEAERREKFAALSEKLSAEVARLGFQSEQWAEQRIQRLPGVAARREADVLLHELAGGNGRLFAADTFDMGVLSPEAGLFSTPATGERGISLAATGSLYFRIGK
ncbi:MAG: hypothetical protein PHS32_05230 [Rhodoferax sp.]|uniref:hypothetical protein n=1 Tax=Rhodoferax sp. TaxID=50421 RepID=UPI002603BB86|nr:hypothetical protein [Rhodoferax sp.]MDD5333130.1 hypothetical protein [Rhodoferax sp.]